MLSGGRVRCAEGTRPVSEKRDLSARPQARLRAGAASRDLTPALGGELFGYVRPDLRVRGVATRLLAHALVLDDGHRRVALLTLDLGAPLVTDRVLAHLAAHPHGVDDVLVSATHTHAGPYRPGPWIAQQAADAVLAAVAALAPATARWGQSPLPDLNVNRSVEAHLADHGLELAVGAGHADLDPDGEAHTRDVGCRVLRVDHADGRPLAIWAHVAVHPTAYVPANTASRPTCSATPSPTCATTWPAPTVATAVAPCRWWRSSTARRVI